MQQIVNLQNIPKLTEWAVLMQFEDFYQALKI